MISKQALAQQATLFTPRLKLEQLSAKHFTDTMAGINNPESSRLTGTLEVFTFERIQTWLTGLPGRDDRADWAIIRQVDGVFLGEVVLNELDEHNMSMNFRIALSSPEVFNQGYGTEVTRAVIDYGLHVVGLHRISLSVFAFNPRAKRVYEKCGFVQEGVARDALFWDGAWVDSINMSVLSSDPRT
jgi:RimJ/RimL family protein N-acetyltransferase